MNIIEGNILIAKFLGWTFHKKTNFWNLNGYTCDCFTVGKEFLFNPGIRVNKLDFHSSWDSLMFACKKWDELDVNIYKRPNLKQLKINNEYIELCERLDHFVTLYEILPVWEQLVENIEWYNKLKLNELNGIHKLIL
jgi:hypothetical protein